jgi:hypothetical protein
MHKSTVLLVSFISNFIATIREYFMKNNKGFSLIEVLGVIFLVGVVGITILAPVIAVDADGATRVLQASGYKDVKITGYKWFNGNRDYYNTGFEATAPNGTKASGNVSKGIFFKGSTIRLD